MEYISDWAIQIAAYMIFGSVINNLTRKTAYSKYIRIVMGIILILHLCKPILWITSQEANFSFHLDRYLISEDASDRTFISDVVEKRDELIYQELEELVEQRITEIVTSRGFVTESLYIGFYTGEQQYGQIYEIDLNVYGENEGSEIFGMDSPQIIEMRKQISTEFGVDNAKITIQIISGD